MNEIWPWRFQAGHIAYSTGYTLPAAGRRVNYAIHAPRDGTIDSIEFPLGLVTTPADLKVSLQDMDFATGYPDGVVDQYRVIPSASVVTSAWLKATLTSNGTDSGTKRTVTRGEWLAVVVEFDAAGGNLVLNLSLSGTAWDTLEAEALFNASWSSPTANLPTFVLKFTDGAYAMTRAGGIAPSDQSSVAPTTATSPDEYALRFQLPFGGVCAGALVYATFGAGANTIVLYHPDGSTLTSATANLPGAATSGPVLTQFPSQVALARHVTYRLAVLPTTTTAVTIRTFGVPSRSIMAACAGGAEWYLSSRTDAGVWVDDTLRRPFIAPFLTNLS